MFYSQEESNIRPAFDLRCPQRYILFIMIMINPAYSVAAASLGLTLSNNVSAKPKGLKQISALTLM